MPYYLSKILPLLFMPVSIALAAILAGMILILLGKRKLSVLSLLMAVIILWGASLPTVAGLMLSSLESQYPPLALEAIPQSDCMLILGGAVAPPYYPRMDIELTESSDRVYQAARIFRFGKAATVIVVAGNQPWAKHLPPEAERIKRLLMEWGVPERAILLESDSKTTRENAVNSVELISKANCETNLLVTSATHMPRAKATFENLGIDVVPVTVDVKFAAGPTRPFSRFIPTADALATTSAVVREWMGIWVYRWRGWS